MAGKGDTFRPVHAPTYQANFDAIKWSGAVKPGITIYAKRDDQVVKLPASRTRRDSYDAGMDRSLKDRVLDGYQRLESEGKLTGHDNTRKFAEFTKKVWNDPRLDN